MSPTLVVMAALIAWSPAEPTPSVRGLAAHVDVEFGPRLRARSDQSRDSPILVRVSPGPTEDRQRIEFIGAVAGNFDLRRYIEREDGRPLADLPPIPIMVVSKLPADAGVDLYGTGDAWLNWRAHYRQLMWGALGVWLAVPAAVLGVRAMRRPRPMPLQPPPSPPPSIADQLRAALQIASDRPLTLEESGQLELLLLRYLGGPAIDEGEDLATVLGDLRENDQTRPLVLAMERWLHAKGGGEAARAHAAAALEALRRTRLAVPDPAEAVA